MRETEGARQEKLRPCFPGLVASTLARASNSLAKSDKEETAYSLRLIVHIQILQTDIHTFPYKIN